MRNIKLAIEYDGTNYAGWQRQSRRSSLIRHKSLADVPCRLSKKSIQEVIEKTLQKILQEKVRLIASGRTDAGVHALAQVANFKTHSKIALDKLQRALNGLLPEDITINKIEETPLNFHSRFNAKSKLYRYTMLNRLYPSALLKDRVYFFPYPLNIKLMQDEAKALLGRHNFKSFQASDSKERTAVRTIRRIKTTSNKNLIYIDIEADGFLYKMVRNIAGTLVEIGRGKFPKGSLKKILVAKDRRLAGPILPAKGLCLIKVNY